MSNDKVLNENAVLSESVRDKWSSVIDCENLPKISDPTVRDNVIRLLENQEKYLTEGADGAGTVSSTGFTNVASTKNWDPILFQLIRRTQPSLIANRMFGVQPMSGPTGLIFSMRAHSIDSSGNVVNDLYAPGKTPDPQLGGGTAATPAQDSMTTAEAEALGYADSASGTADFTQTGATDPVGPLAVSQDSPWGEMTFTIDQASVTARSKALKARYTVELAHDLQKIHGLNADNELSTLLAGELTAELNREVIDILFSQAIPTLARTTGGSYVHASNGGYHFYNYENQVAAAGTYALSTDSDGRWEQEHYRNLLGIVNRVSHEVALGTRRGLGNFLVMDPVTASALDNVVAGSTAGGEALNFNHDNVGVTYAGRLLGRYDVFVDPYRTTNDILVGYKGGNVYDAGYYYCPYVPLTVMRTTGEEDMQPRIGFKTRYGMTHNPFVTGTAAQNWYFRKFSVNLNSTGA